MNTEKFIEFLVNEYNQADRELQKEKTFQNQNNIIIEKQIEKNVIFRILKKVKKDYVMTSMEDHTSGLMSDLYTIRKELADFFNIQFYKNTNMAVKSKSFDEYDLINLCERIYKIIKINSKE